MPDKREVLSHELLDEGVATQFYDERYKSGYMDEWPAERKARIKEVISNLELPQTGTALDFGCGNGVLTEVLRQALPDGWEVHGTDISDTAITNARQWHPKCKFFVATDPALAGKTFDLIFSHHVLEHVFDLASLASVINGFAKPKATMLHILPCGNEGSFEHRLSLLTSGGIDPDLGNRFFFEDKGHVRRLSTGDFTNVFSPFGWRISKEFYTCQFYGAIDWITSSGPRLAMTIANPARGVSDAAKSELRRIRALLIALHVMRYPASFVDRRLRMKTWSLRDVLFLIPSSLAYVISKPADLILKALAEREWKAEQHNRAGSEMFISVVR